MRPPDSRTIPARRTCLLVILTISACLPCGCRRGTASREEQKPAATGIAVLAGPAEPIIVRAPGAEFDLWPSGYLQAYQNRLGKRYTLEEPEAGSAGWGDRLVADGNEVGDFVYDFRSLKQTPPKWNIGAVGKRIEVIGRSKSRQIEKTVALEMYDDFPNLAVTSMAYLNLGTAPLRLDRIQMQRHRLDASLMDVKAEAHQFWTFDGASFERGRDVVYQIAKNFSLKNQMGSPVPTKGEFGSVGGGIPVVAIWTATLGLAIGHVEPVSEVVSFPARILPDGRLEVSMEIEPDIQLKPGETYATPRSFVSIYQGDYYEALRLYAAVLEREGLAPAKSTDEDYGAAWGGAGYEPDVTPAQMLGTIPKLKEMKIRWATLDGRWFDNYGDWEPRTDTFPGDAIKKMVQEFHRQGILVQLGWMPLGAEDGEARTSRKSGVARVVKEHPDWLVLDRNGKNARMARNLATLCPALPEVQDYYRKLTARFIRDWGFDGHKLNDSFTVPACHNPKHHHKSPEDSIRAMGEVYKAILQLTQTMKPQSVTQIHSNGTPPNFAWLAFEDRGVTADPMGSLQVRRRIKMYKALLGPQAAVSGDDVELTRVAGANSSNEQASGRDFASIVGTGGVVGTRFILPNAGGRSRSLYLTPEKEVYWQKWMKIYNDKLVSKGTFRNLYLTGYDVPEGYAIEKDGKMYYAFFSPQADEPWKGELELRGLKRGRYRVYDYAEGKELGTYEVPGLKMKAEFTDHLLLELTPK